MFDLEPVGRYRLARPPLVQAICQVRFPVRTHLQTVEGIAAVQDQLDHLFPYLREQQVHAVSLVVGPGGPPEAGGQTMRSWEFSDGTGWVFSLAPDSASLTVGPQYGSFDEFAERFHAILVTLADAASVSRCDRIGVRYIDIAETDGSDPDAWRTWFRPELAGWGATDVLDGETTLVASITQTQLSTRPVGELSGPPVDVQAIIRHGYVPPNTGVPGAPVQPDAPSFLLDMDLFVEAPQQFDVDALSEQVDILHTQIDRFFRWTLAAAGEEYFGVQEVE